MDLKAWLDAPVTLPRRVIVASALSGFCSTCLSSFFAIRLVEKEANKTIDLQNMTIEMQKESVDFLLEHASTEVHVALNEKLDFWRAVHGMPVQGGGE